jgi:hypothetical protein
LTEIPTNLDKHQVENILTLLIPSVGVLTQQDRQNTHKVTSCRILTHILTLKTYTTSVNETDFIQN